MRGPACPTFIPLRLFNLLFYFIVSFSLFFSRSLFLFPKHIISPAILNHSCSTKAITFREELESMKREKKRSAEGLKKKNTQRGSLGTVKFSMRCLRNSDILIRSNTRECRITRTKVYQWKRKKTRAKIEEKSEKALAIVFIRYRQKQSRFYGEINAYISSWSLSREMFHGICSWREPRELNGPAIMIQACVFFSFFLVFHSPSFA